MALQGLRDMLEISRKSGSLSNPLVGPKKVSRGCQTDDLPEEPVCCPTASNSAGLDPSTGQEVMSHSDTTHGDILLKCLDVLFELNLFFPT